MAKLIENFCSVLLIMLFSYAAIAKLTDFNGFTDKLLNQPFPSVWAYCLSVAIPGAELLIAGLLLWDKTRTTGFNLSIVLLTSFTVYVGLVWTGVFDRVPCSCGGIIEKLGWNGHLILNLTFLLVALSGASLVKDSKT